MGVCPLVTSKPGLEGDEPEQSWPQLVERVTHGDQAALAQVYDCTSSPIVFGLVLRIVGDRATAEEVTLDVYTQVWRQACRYNTVRGTASSWLLMLARSRAIDQLRTRIRRTQNREKPLAAAATIVELGLSPEDTSAEAGGRRIVVSRSWANTAMRALAGPKILAQDSIACWRMLRQASSQ